MRLTQHREINSVIDEGIVRLHPQVPAQALREIIRRTGCLLDGHFALQCGRHSQYFLRALDLLSDPADRQQVAEWLTADAPESWRDEGTVVLCPESAGFQLGSAVATHLGRDLAVTRVDLRRRPEARLRRGDLSKAKRVIVVNDVWTSGQSLRPLFDFVRRQDVQVCGLIVVGARDPNSIQKQSPHTRWLLETKWPIHPAEACPACQAQSSDPLIPAVELN